MWVVGVVLCGWYCWCEVGLFGFVLLCVGVMFVFLC